MEKSFEIRKEDPQLLEYGRRMAQAIRPNGTLQGRKSALHIQKDVQILKKSCEGKNLASKTEQQWLYDNFYLLKRDEKAISQAFSGAGKMRASGHNLLLLELADCFVKKCSKAPDESAALSFFSGVQTVYALTEQELSLLPEALRAAFIHALAAGQCRCELVFTALRWLDSTQWSLLLEKLSRIEETLQKDPAGVYMKMDAQSRQAYRQKCAALAKKYGISQTEAAQKVLELACQNGKHIGEYLYEMPLGYRSKQPLTPYLMCMLLLPVVLSLWAGAALSSVSAAIILFFPVHDAVSFLFNWFYTRFTHPQRLPRLDYTKGIPDESRTLAVSVVLLTKPQEAQEAVKRLEQAWLANRRAGSGLQLAILMDYGESKKRIQDQDAAIRLAAVKGIEELNQKYGDKFSLFIRERSYSEADRIWRGRERKRGAILELCALLRQGTQQLQCFGAPVPEGVQYLIVLDGDTRLNMDTAAELAGTMAHPLSKPVLAEDGRLLRGHALLQPGLRVSLTDAQRSPFAQIFAGQGGLDPYGGVNSDVYQDLFGQGSYCGKGILSIDAFLSCVGSIFPPERLLSHDLMEGACTGCAFLSDVILTEGFPSGILSYYERQNRWIRGDWQTIPWLFPGVRNGAGKRVSNPVSQLSRYKILDNLCRSLLPIMQFLSIFLYLLTNKGLYLYCSAVVLGSMAIRVLFQLRIGGSKRYRSHVFYGAGKDLLQVFWLLLLLPYSAWVSLSAIGCALYRMLISHRNLLRWVTSAQREAHKDGVTEYVLRMWPCLLSGLVLLLYGGIPGKAMGVLWLLTPVAACYLSREARQERRISAARKQFLLRCGGDIWRYFDTFVTAERNWLPPDNVQEDPEERIAERTSPTNIGLMLLSFLAGADLGYCSQKAAWEKIRLSLQTLKQMPKYRGHLYNWVDIRSLKPLNPPYISAVDSGNLLACLVILRSAAREQAPWLLETITELIQNMKLDFLYDEQRCLLYIGWNPVTNTPTQNRYDLLESEARTASYLAIARGEVPKKHWRHLSRTLLTGSGMSGLASWTGTMFEYLMPQLFLTEPKGSLLWESGEFCCHMQRRHGIHGLWGVSESGFAERDRALNYSYKAHGIQALALCVGMDREQVISPYASFLTLSMGTAAPVRNLLRLRHCGMEGRFGFYEALDFTPSRTSPKGVRVQSYMVHHLAMSLLAIDNALQDGILQKRFAADPEMAACQELLEETTPVGRKIRSQLPRKEAVRPKRPENAGFHRIHAGIDPVNPLFCPLSNGTFHALVNDLGYQRCTWNGILLHACDETPFAEAPGVLLFAACADVLIPLQPAPDYGDGVRRSGFSDGASLTLYSEQGGLAFSQRITVSAAAAGQQRTVTLHNRTAGEQTITLALYLEPVLCRQDAYLSHPAFHRLCIEPSMNQNILCFARRGGGSEPAAAMGIGCSLPFTADTDSALCFGRGRLRNLHRAMKENSYGVRAAEEPCAFLRLSVRLRPGEKQRVLFAIAAGDTVETATAETQKLLCGKERSSVYYHNAVRKWLPGQSPEEAFSLLTLLMSRKKPLRNVTESADFREPLWRYGISGDYPVYPVSGEKGETHLREWAFLHELGFHYDLVIQTADGGVYGSPQRTELSLFAGSLGLSEMENKPAGFHFFPGGKEEWEAFCRFVAVKTKPGKQGDTDTRLSEPWFLPESADTRENRSVTLAGQTVVTQSGGGIGLRAWTHILTNGSLGWLAADTGCGSLWLDNARECRLTPWKNDPLALNPAEELCLLRDGQTFFLLAFPDGNSSVVEYGIGYIRWQRKLPGGTESTVTGFIPIDENRRILLVELNGRKENDRIRCRVNLERELFLSVAPGKSLAGGTDFTGLQTHGALETVPDCVWAEYKAEPALCISLATQPRSAPDITAGRKLLEHTTAFWKEKTNVLRLESPEPALNAYLNGWAVYQVLACRLLGRNSLYQNGGAYGFRDQLQDVCALADYDPAVTRRHLLYCAAHQYEEGDVIHWWHPEKGGDKGVRTRCSDDLLWLTYAVTVYLEKTGDSTILQETIPFLHSDPLKPEEDDRYESPRVGESGTLLEHCKRVLMLVLERGTGAHGLLRMGAGDWNDGYNRVLGESVWLTWFAAMIFKRFEKLLPEFSGISEKLTAAANASWADGQFLRGWYEDGTPLGAAGSAECAIDSLSQSFAVLSGLGEPVKSRAAVRKAAMFLTDRETGLIRLFTPAFDGIQEPGYIRSYLPGVRENGGQYTHAAVWLAAACLRCGETELGWELLSMLLPWNKPQEIYQTEPFVLSADVYDNPSMRGRGGWSWYTGAAGWFLRTAVEELLGLWVREGRLTVQPNLPKSWQGYRAEMQVGAMRYAISVERNGEEYEISVKNIGKKQ